MMKAPTATGDEPVCSKINTNNVSTDMMKQIPQIPNGNYRGLRKGDNVATSTMGATISQVSELANGGNCGNAASSSSSSYIKASLSMTSLPPNEHQEGREVIKAKLRVERPYNSLKKYRTNEREMWRHSWASGHSQSSCSLHSNATSNIVGLLSGKDDFWAALQTNYNYIMDTHLMDTCKEARFEIEGAAAVMENETIFCSKMLDTTSTQGSYKDPKELRRWLRDMEDKLIDSPTLSEATQFSVQELQKRLESHSVLYREIVSHARVVSACIRAFEKNSGTTTETSSDQQSSSFTSTDEVQCNNVFPLSATKKTTDEGNLKALERRYHLLYLKAIEVQCVFETLLGRKTSAATNATYGTTTSDETDDEQSLKPVHISYTDSDDCHELKHHDNKVVKKSTCHKQADYADGDDEDEGDDEIDYPFNGKTPISWAHLNFKSGLTRERIHQWYTKRSVASTDFDADSEGSDNEDIDRPRRSEKYTTVSNAVQSQHQLLASKNLIECNNPVASTDNSLVPQSSDTNDSVSVVTETMDNNSQAQATLINGIDRNNEVQTSIKSPFNINSTNIKAQENQLPTFNLKAPAGVEISPPSAMVLTASCSIGNVMVEGSGSSTTPGGTGSENGSIANGSVRKRPRIIDYSKFTVSNRKSDKCATFYIKHSDTENETSGADGGFTSSQGSDILKSAEASSDDDEGWMYSNNADENQTMVVEKGRTQSVASNDDSDKENKKSTIGTASNTSSNASNTLSMRGIGTTTANSPGHPITTAEIPLNETSHYSNATTGNVYECSTLPTVMHRSVVEIQLDGNNLIVQSNKACSAKGSSKNSENHPGSSTEVPNSLCTKSESTKPTMGHFVANRNGKVPISPKKTTNVVTAATFEVSPAKEISHESIKQLVLEAEHLVRDEALKTPTTRQHHKHSLVKISSTVKKREVIMPGPAKQRIQEWLEHQPANGKPEILVASVPTTDCEASGEASESDSVARDTDTSEGLTDSVATCMQTTGGSTSNGNSIEHIGGSAEPISHIGSNHSLNAGTKVIRRQNRRKSDRPWSVSCLSQLTERNSQNDTNAQGNQAGLATHSISESALDNISPGRKRAVTKPTSSVKNSDSKNSLKRRKTRRKRHLGKKSESGSDGMLQMRKTESLSSGQTIQEITTSLLHIPKSSAESAEDRSTLRMPKFRVGSYTTNESKLGSLAALATDMIDDDQQGEYNTGTEDHHSSFSETAWDNYQEKYLSENYSEGLDSDAARRLLEFRDDDYRDYIDSQSDCRSSLSAANNLDSHSPPRMDSLQHHEVKYVTQEITVDHVRRRRALEYEYDRRRKPLEIRRKSCQDDNQNIRSNSGSLSSSANALSPKTSEKYPLLNKADTVVRKLEFGMSHSAQSLRRTSESDTSSRRRKDDRRRSSRNLEKPIKLIPATSSSSDDNTDDEKEMRNLLAQSKKRLEDTRSLKKLCHRLHPEDYTDIIKTCKDNISCLKSVVNGSSASVMSAGCLNATKDLLSSWEELLAWSENAASARNMQEEMVILKKALNRLGSTLTCDLDTKPTIQLSIEALESEKSQLQSYRDNIKRLNASVHTWLTRQERKLTAELAEIEGSVNATTASLDTNLTGKISDTAKGIHENTNTLDGAKTSVGTITLDQDKYSDLATIIQLEPEFYKHLKDEVSEMYSAWDEANARISNQLEILKTSLMVWRQLESELYEFQQILGKDRGTLKGIEGALDNGKTTPVELAQNVKLVAKLLSEKGEVSQEQLTAVQEHLDPSRIFHIAQFTASSGSLSDSGISDGGTTSDGGLSERERRLGILRRLAKQLESALAPGSEAMKSIAARMESAETELKSLQDTCRDLIVRTAASHNKKMNRNNLDGTTCAGGNDDNSLSIKNSPSSSPLKRRNKRNKKSSSNNDEMDPSYNYAVASSPDSGDPDDSNNDESAEFDSSDDENKNGKPGWMKRIAKIAVPMQVALFTLLWAACVMQPNCCDNLNTLSMSFTPQLRYIRGPPPI